MKLKGKRLKWVNETEPKDPSIAKWVDALHAAADFTIRCPSWKGTHFANEVECPWCEEPRPSVCIAGVFRWQRKPGHCDELFNLEVTLLLLNYRS